MKMNLSMAMLAILWLAGPAPAQERVEQRRPASRDGTVKITNAAGSVRVTGWDRDTVVVTGTLGSEVEELEFTTDERASRVRVVLAREHRTRRVTGTDLEVRVPESSHVAVRTAAGGIEIVGVRGAIDLESVAGDLEVHSNPRFTYARSVSGDIELRGTSKLVRAHTISGAITVRRAPGYLDVSSVSGDLRVTGLEVWEGKMTSVSGDLFFEGGFDSGGSFYLESNSGTVTLDLAAHVSADFEVTTFGGPVEFEGAIEATAPAEVVAAGSGRLGERRELSLSTGGGGALVRIKTFKGALRIAKRH